MKRYIAGALIGLALVMTATFGLDQLSKRDSDGTISGRARPTRSASTASPPASCSRRATRKPPSPAGRKPG
jgi:hypothetical protein